MISSSVCVQNQIIVAGELLIYRKWLFYHLTEISLYQNVGKRYFSSHSKQFLASWGKNRKKLLNAKIQTIFTKSQKFTILALVSLFKKSWGTRV
jgi:hypothetical protein